MAIIMTHHMAIISAQFAAPQTRGSVAVAIALMSMPGMSMPDISEVMSAVCWWGNSATLVISQRRHARNRDDAVASEQPFQWRPTVHAARQARTTP
ncbi:hypothetical protein NKH71_14340 [Mesorhizobium sp. M0983]|uniref:hypothetical protein n=1 Tax=Mesorhizobium sp. M0983 TaxID=2957040 RepID=UPI00333C6D0B